MAHHSDDQPLNMAQVLKDAGLLKDDPYEATDRLRDEFARLHQRQEQHAEPLGATGRFPEGKLSSHDEGEIRIALTRFNGAVIFNFGKSIASIGFTPTQAREIGELLIKHAAAIEAGEPDPRA